jgi:hypothetical protein
MKLAAKKALAVLAALTILTSPAAHAATLIGDVITAEYDHPTVGAGKCTSLCFNPVTFTVGSGIESSAHPSSEAIDFSDHALTITFLLNANFAADTFNGFVFSVVSGNPFDPVFSVSGIASSLVSEPNGQLAINFNNQTFEAGAQIVVTFGSAAPLPGALPLFSTALGALALLGWRRKKKPAISG